MRVGIPKGLLYYKYYPFIEEFLLNLDVEIIVSEDTNKTTLNDGIKYCVDEACLPIKIFHGHVVSLVNKCDLIIVPRIMSIKEKEFICPKFCGIPEMIKNSIEDLPKITELPIYMCQEKSMYSWCKYIGKMVRAKPLDIKNAYDKAKIKQSKFKVGIKDCNYKFNIGLLGHPYNIYDNFINMNLIDKLHKLGTGVITEEFIPEEDIEKEVTKLFKRPFWTFARNAYGASGVLCDQIKVDGIIYISSFVCGIDSIVIELIRDRIKCPLLILKIDEHTGEGGLSTRIEAFIDMMERRNKIESNISKLG